MPKKKNQLRETNAAPPAGEPAAPPTESQGALALRTTISWLAGSIWRQHALALAVIGLLVFAMFGSLLFAGGTRIFGNQLTDLYLHDVAWRDFGFSELKKGNLALWVPNVFCGAPFFGGAQGALLYPINALALILPLAASLNWTIALNIFLLGASMYAWMASRGLRPAAALFAGVLMMFSGANFMHVYAGHTAHMAVMAWGPLIFAGIDAIFRGRRLAGAMVGMFGVAMQVLGGHPQYLFFTAIAAGFYTLFKLPGTKWSLGLFTALAGIYFGGVLLSAIQLLASFQATGESIRSIPLPYEMAKTFALPPENIIGWIAPNFFGDMIHQPYWGRCYLWELSLYVGVTGFLLAIYGAIYGENRKEMRAAAILTGIMLLFALGAHTPLFKVLYYHVPGFNKFRGIVKFIYPIALFVTLLAASGLDRLLQQRKVERNYLIFVFSCGGLIALAGICVYAMNWGGLMHGILNTGESYLPPENLNKLSFITSAQHYSSIMLFIASLTCLAVGGLLAGMNRQKALVYAVIALGMAEVFAVARNSRDTFDIKTIVKSEIKSFLDAHPGDYRILDPYSLYSAVSMRARELWGTDPCVVKRYAEFMTWTQKGDPDTATQYVSFAQYNPLYAMLRLKYVFLPEQTGVRRIEAPLEPLPRLLLVHDFRSLTSRDQIFKAMGDEDFDPRKTVFLESQPNPIPVESDQPGTAQVTNSSTDYLEIEAETAKPAILLITDVYTPAWKATALPGSSQKKYEVLPANYVLRAIPLEAGHHKLRVEYTSPAYQIGKWVSVFSWLAFLGAVKFKFLPPKSAKKA